jgi:hypothetical protein
LIVLWIWVDSPEKDIMLWMSRPSENQPTTPQQEATVPQAPVKQGPIVPAASNPSPECPKTSMAKARQSTAALLQKIYEKEGRMLKVTVAGANCEILELSSGILAEGNHTFDAAQRETVGCSDCMLLYKREKFKAVRFIGPDMNLEYLVQ